MSISDSDRQLQALVEQFERAVAHRESKRQLVPILEKLMDLFRTQADEEEITMSAVGYPRLKEHRQAHRELSVGLITLLQELRITGDIAAPHTLEAISTSLRDHEQKHDAPFMTFLAESPTHPG